MDLELRDITVSDLDGLLPLVPPWLCDPLQHEALRAMWLEIILAKRGIAAVATGAERPYAIVHFFFGIFVGDRRAEEYHQCRHPLIARRLLAEWIAGKRPFLHGEEIARANAGTGLNLVAAYFGGPRDDGRASIANYESARRAIRGWNLRSYTAEVFSVPPRDYRDWGRSLGYRVLEYSDDELRTAGVPEDWRPLIWAATRRDAEFNYGYATALLFKTYAVPRFAFTPREQQMLNLALDGATDSSIARTVGITESGVKKHFRTVYEKVHAAGVFEPLATTAEPAELTRGVELRRHLLTYLREHLEELRPYQITARSVPVHR